jgi:hypothetical protein
MSVHKALKRTQVEGQYTIDGEYTIATKFNLFISVWFTFIFWKITTFPSWHKSLYGSATPAPLPAGQVYTHAHPSLDLSTLDSQLMAQHTLKELMDCIYSYVKTANLAFHTILLQLTTSS